MGNVNLFTSAVADAVATSRVPPGLLDASPRCLVSCRRGATPSRALFVARRVAPLLRRPDRPAPCRPRSAEAPPRPPPAHPPAQEGPPYRYGNPWPLRTDC